MLLHDLGGALWRQRLVVVLVIALVAAVAAIGVALAPKTYSASATVRVQPAESAETAGAALAGLTDSTSVATDVERRLDRAGGQGGSSGTGSRSLGDTVSAQWMPRTDTVVVTALAAHPRDAASLADAVTQVLPLHDVTGDVVFTLGPPSVTPAAFVRPDLQFVAVVAVLVALVLAVAAAALRDIRGRTVSDGAEVEETTSAPLLAHVPGPAEPGDLPSLDPGAAGAAVFTRLVRALEVETSRHQLDRIVVAGVVGGDVAAWVAANLAVTWARTRQVLLVDGRLDAGSGLQPPDAPEGPGLHDVLSGTVLDDALIPGPVPGLAVLASGGATLEQQPAHAGSAFVAVMEQAGRRHDALVVLAPPLGVSDDARLMAAGAGLVLVVPEGRLKPSELRAHADRVRAAGGRVTGVVMTGARVRTA